MRRKTRLLFFMATFASAALFTSLDAVAKLSLITDYAKGGGVQVGYATDACSGTILGALSYNSATRLVSACLTAGSWTQIATAGGIAAAGSNTQVQFNSGGVMGANNNLVWDNTNKWLGIGTTTPGSTLDINNTSSPTTIYIHNGSTRLFNMDFYGNVDFGNYQARVGYDNNVGHYAYSDYGTTLITSGLSGGADNNIILKPSGAGYTYLNSVARLAKYSSAPFACTSGIDGALALTHVYTLCLCNGGSSAWVQSKDGTTACSW